MEAGELSCWKTAHTYQVWEGLASPELAPPTQHGAWGRARAGETWVQSWPGNLSAHLQSCQERPVPNCAG